MSDLICPYCDEVSYYDGDCEGFTQDSTQEFECPECEKEFSATVYWALVITDAQKKSEPTKRKGREKVSDEKKAKLKFDGGIVSVDKAEAVKASNEILSKFSQRSPSTRLVQENIELRTEITRLAAENSSLKEQIKLTSVFTAKSYEDEIEKLKAENEALKNKLEVQKQVKGDQTYEAMCENIKNILEEKNDSRA